MKRFRFNGRTNCIEYDNESILLDSYGEDIEELLNEQHETIEMLNQQLRIFSDGLKAEIRETKEVFEDYSECVDEKKQLKEENEQLKSRCNDYDKALKTLQGLTDRKLKENEQLKHSIKCLEADKMELQQYIKRMQGDVE